MGKEESIVRVQASMLERMIGIFLKIWSGAGDFLRWWAD